MENISFRILRIFIFVYTAEFQTAQLSSVPEPCPDIDHYTTIADMCTSEYANELPSNGGSTVDSVALRVLTQQDGCTCEDKTDSSNMQTTQQMTDPAIHDNTVSENGNAKIPVIIAAVIGWCLTALFSITTLCLYRRMTKQRPNNSSEQNVIPQYDDLHVTRLSSCYSSLNALAANSDQHTHI